MAKRENKYIDLALVAGGAYLGVTNSVLSSFGVQGVQNWIRIPLEAAMGAGVGIVTSEFLSGGGSTVGGPHLWQGMYKIGLYSLIISFILNAFMPGVDNMTLAYLSAAVAGYYEMSRYGIKTIGDGTPNNSM